MFTHPDTETETDMACIEFCGGVHTAEIQRAMRISLGFCTHFIGICMGLGVELLYEHKNYYATFHC